MIFLIFLIFLICICDVLAQLDAHDRSVVEELYANYGVRSSLDEVMCPSSGRPRATLWCDADGKVTRFMLFHRTVEEEGELLPDALFQLTALRSLELTAVHASHGNALDERLGRLSELVTLTIAHTSLQGTLPSAVWLRLSNLAELQIAENERLSGAIPSQLGALTRLQELQLFKNALQATIPSQIGRLTELLHFYVFQNQMHGAVPSQLSHLSALKGCRLTRYSSTDEKLCGNEFQCPLPPSLPPPCYTKTRFGVKCDKEEL